MSYTKKTFDETMSAFKQTMRLWRSVTHWEVIRNVKRRNGTYRVAIDQDGYDRQRVETLDFTTVGVRLVTSGPNGDVTRELQMRKYTSAADNFRALFNCLEDLRMFEQRGLSELAEQFFRPQLPPPAVAPLAQTAYGVLGVAPDAPLDVIEAAYKAQAKRLHPDAGGSVVAFQRLTEAMGQIRKERGA